MTAHTLRWTLLCVLIVTTAASSARAQLPEQAAELVPADVAVFIELRNLAELRGELENDPLVNYLREHTPARREPDAWRAVQDMLGMSGEEIFDRYFGKQVALIGQSTEHGGPGLLLSRVSNEDAALAVDRLQLQQIAEPGAFTLYQTGDGQGRIAFADGWMAMGDPQHDAYIRRTLGRLAEGDALADSEQFQEWVNKVAGSESFARLFVRNDEADQVHAAGLKRSGGELVIDYAGTSNEVGELFRRTGDAGALEFGPLPRQTLSATSFNLRDREPDPRWVELMDRLVAPASFRDDVLPLLDAPVVTFLGEVPGDELEPEAGFRAPVLGIAIKLSDHAAVEHLTRAMDGLMVLANMGTLQMDLPAIEVRDVEHEGVSFRSANVGEALAVRLDEPGLRGAAQVSFGRVGDWYVVATNAQFFRWTIDAHGDEAARLTEAADLERMNLVPRDRPVLTSFTRTPELAAHFQSWLDHIDARAPHWTRDADRMEPQTEAGRAIKGLTLLSGILDYYESASVQVFGEDEETLRATATLRRK